MWPLGRFLEFNLLLLLKVHGRFCLYQLQLESVRLWVDVKDEGGIDGHIGRELLDQLDDFVHGIPATLLPRQS
jgi:hypothetical protein